MDPATAVGLASGVVQFVDFTSKLISATHKLYVSASGATVEHLELEELARDLQQRAEDATPHSISNIAALSREERTLIKLGEYCREVSDELLRVLQSLRLKGGSHKKWKSFYLALKSVWKEEEIVALQQRLDRIGYTMNTQILYNLQSRVLNVLERLEAQNRKLEVARERDIIELQEATKKQIKDGLDQEGAVTFAFTQLSLSTKKSSEYSAEQRVLDSLRFDDMEYRHTTLRSAHEKTFSWIFGSAAAGNERLSPSKFVDWLHSDDNLFWISGKIGSGKSTLIKYICTHQLVKNNLQIWGDGCQLVITSFFFWNASKTELPKSKEGLLRSILYQILRQAPDLIQFAPPGQWTTYVSSGSQNYELGLKFLTLLELQAAFERISTHLSTAKIKFCFFIDGLDEYEGKPDEIIPIIDSLKASPYVKMCVSSRRWNQFEKAFGQDSLRKLYIEAFTTKDIEVYVRETLEKDSDYQEMKESDESSVDLAKEIVGQYSSTRSSLFIMTRHRWEHVLSGWHNSMNAKVTNSVERCGPRCISLGLPRCTVTPRWPHGRRQARTPTEKAPLPSHGS